MGVVAAVLLTSVIVTLTKPWENYASKELHSERNQPDASARRVEAVEVPSQKNSLDRKSPKLVAGENQATGAKEEPKQLRTLGNDSLAKEKLKLALDSWVFGDSREKFVEDHPEIAVIELDWSFRKVLMRYEIAASRGTPTHYEVAVILVFQSQAGTEIKKRALYLVQPPCASSAEWVIARID